MNCEISKIDIACYFDNYNKLANLIGDNAGKINWTSFTKDNWWLFTPKFMIEFKDYVVLDAINVNESVFQSNYKETFEQFIPLADLGERAFYRIEDKDFYEYAKEYIDWSKVQKWNQLAFKLEMKYIEQMPIIHIIGMSYDVYNNSSEDYNFLEDVYENSKVGVDLIEVISKNVHFQRRIYKQIKHLITPEELRTWLGNKFDSYEFEALVESKIEISEEHRQVFTNYFLQRRDYLDLNNYIYRFIDLSSLSFKEKIAIWKNSRWRSNSVSLREIFKNECVRSNQTD